MGWPASILVALLSAGPGLLLAGWLANSCVSWYRISGFEGKAGCFVVAIALLGATGGIVTGLAVSRVIAGGEQPGFLKALIASFGVIAALTGLAAAVARRAAHVPPRIDGRTLDLEVEFRLPAGAGRLAGAEAESPALTLSSVIRGVRRRAEAGLLRIDEAREEDGRAIVPGSVFLFTDRGRRVVSAEAGGKALGGFLLPLPAWPGRRYLAWSDWLPRPRPPAGPWPDSRASVRFRVVPHAPPPPAPYPAEEEAGAFAALAPDAPLPEWLRFLDGREPEDRRLAILKTVEERLPELPPLILSGDTASREAALRAVSHLGIVPPEVMRAVLAEQRRIVEELRLLNGMGADDPAFLDRQVALRSRFSYWHRAWWTVHRQTGADGRPPVQEILDLALVRARDTTLGEIVTTARAHLDALPPAAPPAPPQG